MPRHHHPSTATGTPPQQLPHHHPHPIQPRFKHNLSPAGNQRRLQGDGPVPGGRRQRYGQFCRHRGPELGHRRHAGAARLGGQAGHRDEALHGRWLRGRRQPRLHQGQHRHAAWRRQEDARCHQGQAGGVRGGQADGGGDNPLKRQPPQPPPELAPVWSAPISPFVEGVWAD
eukprot:scaffold3099_cov100-Isochrysis_galbana.AAC.1